MSVFRSRVLRSSIIVVLTLAALGLAGCSSLRIGYATAPDLVYWWLDAYIDFNRSQSPRVHEAIDQWFAWHRRTQLPDYAAVLAKARAEVVADTTAARVCDWEDQVVQRARIAFERFSPAVVDTLLTVTPEQVRFLERRYARNDAQYRDDFLQPDLRERNRKSVQRITERAETLYGSLDEREHGLVADAVARSPFDPTLWLTEREARQQEVLQMLRTVGGTGATREQAQAALSAYVAHLEHSPRDPYETYSRRLAQYNCQFAASLHNATTAAQRRHAAETLAGWEDDLRTLAATEPAHRHVEP